jgi:hypothetical protein
VLRCEFFGQVADAGLDAPLISLCGSGVNSPLEITCVGIGEALSRCSAGVKVAVRYR